MNKPVVLNHWRTHRYRASHALAFAEEGARIVVSAA